MRKNNNSICKVNGSLPRFLTSFALDKRLAKNAWNEYLIFSNNLFESYGEQRAVKVLKELNNACRHYACGYPKINRSLAGIWFRPNKSSGIPAKLRYLKEMIQKEPNLALAIPNSVYAIKLTPDYSVKTVEDPSKSTMSLKDYAEFEEFCRGNCPSLLPSKVSVNITLKAGPNGPASICQVQDLVTLMLSGLEFSQYTNYIKLIYGENSWLEECYNNLVNKIHSTNISELKWRKLEPKIVTSKLEFLSGPAGKTRIVYILNWWAQTILLPLHDTLMSHFRKMKGDCTWNQDKGVELIRLWSKKGLKLYSFDLSAATDRWPIQHQSLAIKAVFGEEIGKCWHQMMTIFTPYSSDLKRYVKYSVGQPMGAYSSWAALNLTHHMTVRYLAKKYRQPCKYMVLGDDLVIAGEILANKYKEYMTKLGVDINESKSILNEEGKPSSAEFARHLVKNGRVIGTISPNLLTQIFQNGEDHMIVELIRELRIKLGCEVIITTDTILLPKALGVLLSNKQKHNTAMTLSIPVDFGQPVTFKDKLDEDSDLTDYIQIVNPWKGLDKSSVLNTINMRYINEAKIKLEQLNLLHTNLQHGKNVTSGYMLEWEEHPIHYMIKNLTEELSMQAMKVAFLHPRSKIVPGLIQTSAEFLISILTKGETYKEYRDGKSLKIRKISNFIKDLHKKTPVEFIPKAVSWESWGSAWEQAATKS